MTDQTAGKNEAAETIARLVGVEGMPVRLSDEVETHVTIDDWGQVLVADYEVVQNALEEGCVIRDPESGFLKMNAAP